MIKRLTTCSFWTFAFKAIVRVQTHAFILTWIGVTFIDVRFTFHASESRLTFTDETIISGAAGATVTARILLARIDS